MDILFRPKRRAIYRRLWRCRVRHVTSSNGSREEQAAVDDRADKVVLRVLLKRLTDEQQEKLAQVVEHKNPCAGECILIDIGRTSGTINGQSYASHCCRIWRGWKSTSSAGELLDVTGEGPGVVLHPQRMRCLPTCQQHQQPITSVACCNPFHWTIDVSPMTDYLSILNKECSQPCHLTSHDSTDNSDSENEQLTEDTTTPARAPWCRVVYRQYREHIGAPGSYLPIYNSSLHVFGGLHHGSDGLCLSALRQTSAANENTRRHGGIPQPQRAASVTEKTVMKVGRGIIIGRRTVDLSAWLYNCGDQPVFVRSPHLGSSVWKIQPGQSLRIYDPQSAVPVNNNNNNVSAVSTVDHCDDSGPVGFDCVLVSFVKGWSGRYKRQNILSCPCWLELLLSKSH